MRRLSGYRVFVTLRSEYHVRGHLCFGVRNRRTGQWHPEHWSLGKPLATAFTDGRGRLCSLSLPAIGEPLRFLVNDEVLETSAVLSVEEREAFAMAGPLGGRFARTPPPAGDARETW